MFLSIGVLQGDKLVIRPCAPLEREYFAIESPLTDTIRGIKMMLSVEHQFAPPPPATPTPKPKPKPTVSGLGDRAARLRLGHGL